MARASVVWRFPSRRVYEERERRQGDAADDGQKVGPYICTRKVLLAKMDRLAKVGQARGPIDRLQATRPLHSSVSAHGEVQLVPQIIFEPWW